MSYRLRRRESVRDGVRRIADEQLAKAMAEIDGASVDPRKTVDQVRKGLKKLRGLLRLVRLACRDVYEVENATFRDAARRLSGARDAEVLVATCDRLLARLSDVAHRSAFEPILAALNRRKDEIVTGIDLDERLDEVRTMLDGARSRVKDWSLSEKGFEAIAGGLEQTYDRACRAMRDAYDDDGSAAFHEWRKRVKYHWYHTRLLRNCWPAEMQVRRGASSELAEQLGDVHDLAVFDATLSKESDRFTDSETVHALRGLANAAARKQRDRLRPLGRRLFAEKSSSFVDRIEVYWNAWRAT